MKMQAVIFDLDGVLTSTIGYHFKSWKKVLGDYGIVVTSKDNEKLRGLTRRRSLEILLGQRVYPEEKLHAMLQQKNTLYLEAIEKLGPRDLSPGISILLQELHLARIGIGVASASQNVRPILQQLGIDGFIHAQTDGLAVLNSKPAPDVFLETASALRVAPEECLAIEDSQAGIQAARAAGMVVVGLGPHHRVGGAQAVFDDLSRVHLSDMINIYENAKERGQQEYLPVVDVREMA
jgi:kojibiose phosphorylase